MLWMQSLYNSTPHLMLFCSISPPSVLMALSGTGEQNTPQGDQPKLLVTVQVQFSDKNAALGISVPAQPAAESYSFVFLEGSHTKLMGNRRCSSADRCRQTQAESGPGSSGAEPGMPKPLHAQQHTDLYNSTTSPQHCLSSTGTPSAQPGWRMKASPTIEVTAALQKKHSTLLSV